MLNGKLKYIIYAIILVVFVIIVMYAYRIFYQFKMKKVKAYVEVIANQMENPNATFKVINEMVDGILKSQDETNAVLEIASASNKEKELVLVETALNKCISFGFIAKPENTLNMEVPENE